METELSDQYEKSSVAMTRAMPSERSKKPAKVVQATVVALWAPVSSEGEPSTGCGYTVNRRAPWLLPSQCARHLAQVGWIVGIEAALACHPLDSPISRDEHDHRITNRVTVAYPG